MPTRPDEELSTAATAILAPATLPGPPTLVSSPAPVTVPAAAAVLEALDAADRYERRHALGEGGMGVVHLCHDRRIGRDVARKSIRAEHLAHGDVQARFLVEARVQGQLEHPSVVPVYDLGRDPDGTTWFTMKRIRGATLEEVLDGLRAGDPAIAAQHSRRRLLTAFSSACLAVDFAHSRGVLHRDLKPGNLMLGDFGEVLVLDWGLAKLVADPAPDRVEPLRDKVSEDLGTHTALGTILGTPGYMAPEQVRGEPLDARADVYALGAILFELLALEPLHGHGTTTRLIASTLAGADARPSVRAPDREVPPELDAICVRATALKPAERFPSARALHEALERFLDGDRDLELRRGLSQSHARTADAAAWRALDATLSPAAAAEERRTAMRELGRAIALDPDNRDAMQTLLRLLTEVPRELPAEVEREVRDAQHASLRVGIRALGVAKLTVLLYVPFALWMGVRHLASAGLALAAWVLSGLIALVIARGDPGRARAHVLTIGSGALAVAATAVLFGPLFFLPMLASLNCMGMMANPQRTVRWPTIAAFCLAFLAPLALEWLGLLPPSYAFAGGALVLLPRTFALPPTATLAFLVMSNLALIVTPALMFGRLRDALTGAEQRLHLHAWQLRQVVPAESPLARPAPPPQPACSFTGA